MHVLEYQRCFLQIRQSEKYSIRPHFSEQREYYKKAKKSKMLNETVEGADLIFDIGNKIIKDFTVKELPLMTSFIKALINNTKFQIDKKLFS